MLTKKTSRLTKQHLVKKRKKTNIRKSTHRSRPIIHLPSSKQPKINVAAPKVELTQPSPIVIPAPIVNVPSSLPPNIHVAAPNVELIQPAPIVIPAPVVNVPTSPPPDIHFSAPNIELTQPSPIVIPAPVVNVPACPPPHIHVAAPNVELTQPSPIVIPAPVVNVPAYPEPHIHVAAPNVELTQPSPIVIPAPVVNVTTPESSDEAELRSDLLRFVGDVIEVINSGGAGAGGNPLNQIGVLEAVGKGTFAIRPTIGNPDGAQVVYYSIRQITGFRPNVTTPSRNQ